jgi:branched-chain amino acid transport system substrate-binding protein
MLAMLSRGVNRSSFAAVGIAASLLVAACGGGAGTGAAPSGTAAEPIVIGAALALTGANGYLGESEQRSIQYAVDQVNTKGGVLGRPLKLVVADAVEKPAEGVAAVQKLLQEKPVAIIGMGVSAQVLAVAPDVAKAKVLLLPHVATPGILYDNLKNPWIFNFHTTTPDTNAVYVKYAKDTLKASRVALFVDQTALGKAFTDAVKPLLANASMTIVDEETMDVSDNDVSAQVTKILNSKPDVVMGSLYAGESALALREFQKRGVALPPLLGLANIYGVAQGTIPWSTVVGAILVADNPSFMMKNPPADWAAWSDKASTAKSRANDTQSASYDMVLVLANAIQQAGSADPEKVQPQVAKTQGFSGFNGIKTVTSQNYNCDEGHECWHGQSLIRVNGEFDVTVIATYPR